MAKNLSDSTSSTLWPNIKAASFGCGVQIIDLPFFKKSALGKSLNQSASTTRIIIFLARDLKISKPLFKAAGSLPRPGPKTAEENLAKDLAERLFSSTRMTNGALMPVQLEDKILIKPAPLLRLPWAHICVAPCRPFAASTIRTWPKLPLWLLAFMGLSKLSNGQIFFF